ncbi:thioesterase family protein [Rhizobium sp. TRM95796]|uniref:thioesterase family protein n=1 Tax=Rhizobium sp. TRM95796 TaxID=2979862 RepID=UPI0021E7CBA7|nr:thioesterase family protein [Rhizobium sp. TRM95796]MCV3764547.1 thioesterase family protein [Rhizobium sp. TRM95796]
MIDPVTFDTPVIAYGLHTEQDWFDATGCLSSWGTSRIFDGIAATGFAILDCGEAYRARSGCAMALRQAMTSILEPVRQATPLRGAFRLLDAGGGALHVYLEIYDALGRLSAAQEAVYALTAASGAVAAFTDAQRANIEIMLRYHAPLPKPKHRGRMVTLDAA